MARISILLAIAVFSMIGGMVGSWILSLPSVFAQRGKEVIEAETVKAETVEAKRVLIKDETGRVRAVFEGRTSNIYP